MRQESFEAVVRKKIVNGIRNTLIFSVQFSSYFVLYIPLRIFFRAHRSLPDDFSRLTRGSLVIANHQSMVDPFIVMGNLPFFTFVRLLPVRFPTDHEYMASPVLGQALRFFGCYDVGATPRMRMCTLLKTCDLLRSGETVFLFPEGSIARSEMKEFNQGIEFFIREAQSVIFVRMDGFNEPIIHHVLETSRMLCYGEVQEVDAIQHDARVLQESFDLLTGHGHRVGLHTSGQEV